MKRAQDPIPTDTWFEMRTGKNDSQHQPLLVRDVRILDPRTGELIENAEIRLEQGRISAIGDVGKLPEMGALVIDGDGRVALPGLIDCHLHSIGVYLDGNPRISDFRWIPGQMVKNLAAFANSGVTTVRDMCAPLRVIRLFRRLSRTNRITAPRLLISGPILTAPGGYPTFIEPLPALQASLMGQLKVELRTERQANRWVDRLASAGVDVIKVAYSSKNYDDLGTEQPRLNDSLVAAITHRAHHYGLPVAIHHTWKRDLADLINLPFDTLEHLTIDGEISDAIVHRIRARRLPVTTTLVAYGILDFIEEVIELLGQDRGRLLAEKPRQTIRQVALELRDGTDAVAYIGRNVINSAMKHMLANLKKLKQGGVLIGAGTDSGGAITPCDKMVWELRSMERAGLTALEALRTATSDAARVIGRLDLGVLEPGNTADLILCRDNPVEDLRSLEQVDLVVRAGTVLKNDLRG